MAFPDGFVEEVRHSADIVRFISDHISLKKGGNSWKGLCPFHNEKTPSFNVRSEPAVFHCFGCGEGGDVFKFVMLRERVGFPEAVETVARRFGVAVPERRVDAGPERKQREELLAILDAAAKHFEAQLWTGPGTAAREYLLGRGFKKETLERIHAGAAADSWSSLLDALRRQFPLPALTMAGLVLERADGKGHYDRFRNRAVFPIYDESGKAVGFGARSLDGTEPKYLNSPESPVYQKSKVLYGMNWAKEPIRRSSRAVLMEGYLDVARALEAGVGEAVATCGTALTPGHGRLLRRFADAVAVNFDQDDAGRKAARRSIDLLIEEGLRVTVVELPEKHDPDSFVREKGPEAYQARVDEAPPWLEWVMRRAAADNDTGTPEGKAAFLGDLLPSLCRITSAVERSAWLDKAVDRGALDRAAARYELQRAMARAGAPAPAGTESRPAPPPAPKPAAAALLPAERYLVALMLQGGDGVAEALQELDEGEMAGLRSAPVLKAALELAARGERVSVAALQEALTDEDSRRLVSELAVAGAPERGPAAGECVRELKRRPLQARMAEIQKDLGGATGPRLEALLSEKLQLRRLMGSL
jgi:DNA primase